MPLYEGTKTVRAKPMTRLYYNTYRGWEMPANENGKEAGYLVEYTDGGAPNDSRHEGYISWSPADVFERSYKPAGTHIDRMASELTALQGRIEKLGAFLMGGEPYDSLPAHEKALLNAQHGAMMAYQGILTVRLNLSLGA